MICPECGCESLDYESLDGNYCAIYCDGCGYEFEGYVDLNNPLY